MFNSLIIIISCFTHLILILSDKENQIFENITSQYILVYTSLGLILTSIIWLNMAPLHEYPFNNFLFNFGKYNLHKNLNNGI